MKFIRLWGLILFVLIVSVTAAIWLFLADTIVERTIEVAGSRLAGAMVELDKADLTLSPLGLTLTGLQVTDREEPMKNLFEIERSAFLMDPGSLLHGKININEMTIDGVRLATPRKSSGALEKSVKEKISGKREVDKTTASVVKEKLALPSLDLPDVNDILEREELETFKEIETAKAAISSGEERWKKRLDELPDQDKIKGYDRRIKEIEKSFKKGLKGVLSGTKDLEKLKKDIDSDLKNIKEAKRDFDRDLKNLKGIVKDIERAPERDIERIKEKYTLSTEGLSSFTLLLFGDKAGEWAKQIAAWHERLGPYIERAMEGKDGAEAESKPERRKGTDVRFREYQPMPDLLIKRASVTLSVPAGDIKGSIRDISDNQVLTGRPITYDFSGEKLKGIQSFSLKGEVNALDKSGTVNRAKLNIRGYELDKITLSKGGDFPISIARAVAGFDVDAVIKGGSLDASFKGNFNSVEIESGRNGKMKSMERSFSQALSEVKEFSMKGKVSGTIDDPKVRLSSDLDSIIKRAVGKTVENERKRLERELKAAVEEKVKKPIEDIKREIGKFQNFDKELASNENKLDRLLKDAVKKPSKGIKLPF